MSLNIEIVEAPVGAQTIVLRGTLDSDTAPELEQRVDTVLSSGVLTLVFDLAGLNYISSAGLGILFRAKNAMDEKHGKVLLLHLQPQVKKVFEIVKAIPTMAIFRDQQELDDYLFEMQRRERNNP